MESLGIMRRRRGNEGRIMARIGSILLVNVILCKVHEYSLETGHSQLKVGASYSEPLAKFLEWHGSRVLALSREARSRAQVSFTPPLKPMHKAKVNRETPCHISCSTV